MKIFSNREGFLKSASTYADKVADEKFGEMNEDNWVEYSLAWIYAYYTWVPEDYGYPQKFKTKI